MKLPTNHEAVQRKVDWETAEEEAKKVSLYNYTYVVHVFSQWTACTQ